MVKTRKPQAIFNQDLIDAVAALPNKRSDVTRDELYGQLTRHDLKRLIVVNNMKIQTNARKATMFRKVIVICTMLSLHYHNPGCVARLQAWWRGETVRRDLRLRGPAVMARWKCQNTCDLVTLDLLCDIPVRDFYSFRDPMNGKIYGYDILSLYQILGKYKYNPFTRVPYEKGFYTNLLGSVKVLLPKYSKPQKLIAHRPAKVPRTRSENIQMTMVNNPPLLEDVVRQVFDRVGEVVTGGQRQWFDDLNHSGLVGLYIALQASWRQLSIGTRRLMAPIGYRRVFIKSRRAIVNMPEMNLRCRLAIDIRRFLSSEHLNNLALAVQIFLEALRLVSAGCCEFFTNHILTSSIV